MNDCCLTQTLKPIYVSEEPNLAVCVSLQPPRIQYLESDPVSERC